MVCGRRIHVVANRSDGTSIFEQSRMVAQEGTKGGWAQEGQLARSTLNHRRVYALSRAQPQRRPLIPLPNEYMYSFYHTINIGIIRCRSAKAKGVGGGGQNLLLGGTRIRTLSINHGRDQGGERLK